MRDARLIGMKVLEEIRAEFPHLRMGLDLNPAYVDLLLDIPRQPGLAFDVQLNLQHDELYLDVGEGFHVSWFPCTDAAVVERFRRAVRGLLTGSFRIVEGYRGDRCVRAELQEPVGGGWKTIATWSGLHVPWPPRVRTRVLQNRSDGGVG
jgi:hypothetical protein